MDEVLPPPPQPAGGQAQNVQQPPPQQQYAIPPPRQYYRRGYGDILKNPVYIGLGIVVPILLMWLGVLFYAIGIGNSNPTPFYQIAMIFYSLGTAGISIFLLLLGIGRRDLQQWVRAALIFSGAVILTWGFVLLIPYIFYKP